MKQKKKKNVRRRGVEPLPLAWKASMITASPSAYGTTSKFKKYMLRQIEAQPVRIPGVSLSIFNQIQNNGRL